MGRFVEKYSIDCRAPKASLAMTEGISIHTETTSSRLPPNDKAHGNIRHFNKRYLFFITTITGLLLSFSASLAHGGFEKRAGDTVVYVTQTPVSPLVGEPVTVNLVFQANDSLERWKNLDVHIKLVDTFYGDESKDKVIYQTVSKTDANGSLNFYHTFDKENYFDLDISFTNPKTGKPEETGFLIQPRNRPPASWPTLISICAGICVAGTLVTHLLCSQTRKRKKMI
jgi:hypothetical protein